MQHVRRTVIDVQNAGWCMCHTALSRTCTQGRVPAQRLHTVPWGVWRLLRCYAVVAAVSADTLPASDLPAAARSHSASRRHPDCGERRPHGPRAVGHVHSGAVHLRYRRGRRGETAVAVTVSTRSVLPHAGDPGAPPIAVAARPRITEDPSPTHPVPLFQTSLQPPPPRPQTLPPHSTRSRPPPQTSARRAASPCPSVAARPWCWCSPCRVGATWSTPPSSLVGAVGSRAMQGPGIFMCGCERRERTAPLHVYCRLTFRFALLRRLASGRVILTARVPSPMPCPRNK